MRFLPLLLLPAFLSAQSAPDSSRLTLEKLFHPQKKVNYLPTPSVQRSWLPSGLLLENRKGDLSQMNPATGHSDSWLKAADLKTALVTLGLSEAAAKTASERGPGLWNPAMEAFLQVIESDFYLVIPRDARVKRLTQDRAPKDMPAFSPDGLKLAYLRGNDLYVLELAEGQEIRLTTGGSETRFNGRMDWVYEEELYERGTPRAFWWSPDSTRLAYLSFDASAVPRYTLIDDRTQPQKVIPIRYPKAGDPCSTVKLGVVDLKGDTTWMNATHPGEEVLFAQVGWDRQGRLRIAVQDRIQTWMELWRFEGATPTRLIREASPTWQDKLPLPYDLPDGSFLWHTDRTGYRHLEHRDGEGRLLRTLTEGSWDVRSLHGVDRNGHVFFSGTQRNSLGLDAYSVSLEGSAPNAQLKRLTEQPGTHAVTFDSKLTHFLDRWSDPVTPTQQRLSNADGKALPLPVEPLPDAFKALTLGRPKFQTVPTRDGASLSSMLLLPPDFDPTKKYPVYQEIYGGPHAPTVRNAFSRLWWHFLAQQGVVVWLCDNRSASNRGPASAHGVYKRLGQQELDDQLDGLAWLKTQGWADMDRIALEGWSYGGFMSAYAMTHSKAWKAAIVGAPVTDFRLYDAIYTERYMALPKDNPEGYDQTNVCKVAKNVEGALLILHGTLDDNVHPQNTIQFVDALQKANKDFELVLLPGSTHSPRAPEHNWARHSKMWAFLKRELKLVEK